MNKKALILVIVTLIIIIIVYFNLKKPTSVLVNNVPLNHTNDIIFFDFHAGFIEKNPNLFVDHPLVDVVYIITA